MSKENLHFDNQSKQVVPFFSLWNFSKRNKKKHVPHVSVEPQQHKWKLCLMRLLAPRELMMMMMMMMMMSSRFLSHIGIESK